MSIDTRASAQDEPERQSSPDRTSANGWYISSAAATAPWHLLADLGRQQLAASTEAASVLFRGSEAVRRIQQQAAHHASLRHQEAVQKLQASADPSELLTIQAELLRFDVAEASRYWQQLAQAALQTQIEMMGCAGALFHGAHAGIPKPAVQAHPALASPAETPADPASGTA